MKSNLPIIDLYHLLNGSDLDVTTDEQKAVAKEIQHACKTHGFFYVKNHGVDSKLVEKVIQSTKDLFNLSSTKKIAISSKNNELFRGYISTSDG